MRRERTAPLIAFARGCASGYVISENAVPPGGGTTRIGVDQAGDLRFQVMASDAVRVAARRQAASRPSTTSRVGCVTRQRTGDPLTALTRAASGATRIAGMRPPLLLVIGLCGACASGRPDARARPAPLGSARHGRVGDTARSVARASCTSAPWIRTSARMPPESAAGAAWPSWPAFRTRSSSTSISASSRLCPAPTPRDAAVLRPGSVEGSSGQRLQCRPRAAVSRVRGQRGSAVLRARASEPRGGRHVRVSSHLSKDRECSGCSRTTIRLGRRPS